MSEDPEQGTPEVSPANAGGTDWDNPDNPYIQRHRDTQAAWTREKSVWDDENALMARIAEKFPHLIADDDPVDEPDDDGQEEATNQLDPKVAELLQQVPELKSQLDAINNERAQSAFESDLAKAAGDREVTDKAHDWIKYRTETTGNNPEALKKATEEWFEFEDSLISKAAEQRRKRPRAPHVPAGGQAATGGKDPADMTRSELNQFMMDRLNAEAA